MEAAVPPVAGAIVNQAAIPFIKQLTYAFEASENVNALCIATDRLSAKKEDVVRQVGMDVRRGREVKNEVQHWMNRVEVVRKESDEIKERFNQRSCQCFSRCSLNCFSNYRISKAAYQKCSEVQDLCNEAKFEALTFEPLPPASDNVKALLIATDKLSVKKEDVVRQVAREVQRGREVTKVVEQWMERVEVIRKESDGIRERFDQRSCQCFNGCSVNCFTNKISKDAYQKCLEVQVLFDEAKFEALTFEPLSPNVQRLPTTPTIPSIGNLNLELALEHINDAGVGIIGIWGMGGVGKTHLLKQINNSFSGNSIFDHVIFVTASKECSVEKIQIAIAKRLNLELKDHDDNESRANRIFNFLSNRNFLLLLDDLWEKVDLENVGIPFTSSKQKAVLTTRSRNVCRQMETKKEITVDCLNKKDAWRLFEDKVGVETIQSKPNIRDHAEDVVRELDGLPLALITIGRAMHGKSDSRDWEHAIQLLRASRLPEMEECPKEESLFKRLKFSYDSLKTDILRQCFLACSLWPEDYEIKKMDLIQLWLGLGIVEELGNLDIYSPGYALIHNLLDTCLLEACQSEDCVKMHDVLRDMALWIARDCGKNMNKWIIKYGGGGGGSSILLPNDIWCKAEYIALRGYGQVLDIPSIVSGTNLKTLRINQCGFERNINGMYNFSCLTFLDLSYNGLISFPKTICQVVNLRYLNLSHNQLTTLPMDLKFLINLRYLILRFNEINETPIDVFSKIKELIILDIMEQSLVNFSSSNVHKDIESLKKIKALSITVSDNSELQCLSNLVHIPVRELMIRYEKLDEADNSILITPSFFGKSDRQKGLLELTFSLCPGKRQLVFENRQRSINWQFQNLIYLNLYLMSDVENVVYNGVVPKNLFPKLKILVIFGCNYIKNFSWIVYLQCLQRLKIILADPSVHELFTIEQASSSQSAEIEEVRNEAPINKTFPSLEIMELWVLPNVKSICPPAITFPSLKELWVYTCPIATLPFNRTTVPRNLERIGGERSWWDSLEWEDEELKSLLEKKLKFTDI